MIKSWNGFGNKLPWDIPPAAVFFCGVFLLTTRNHPEQFKNLPEEFPA